MRMLLFQNMAANNINPMKLNPPPSLNWVARTLRSVSNGALLYRELIAINSGKSRKAYIIV